MVFEKPILGKKIQLRAVTESDAKFILDLRLNPELNRHLNATPPSIQMQQEWIKKQRTREGDYYFIIESIEGNPYGAIGVYDIDNVDNSFNWGRWIIAENSPFYVAIESTILVYYFAFEILNLDTALSDVRLGNKNVIKFHLSYGSTIYKDDGESVYYKFFKTQFQKLLSRYKNLHNIHI